MSLILGIESSCDESALCLFSPQKGIVGEWVSSQCLVQSQYGGVVPDLASREHLKNFFPLLEKVQEHPEGQSISKIAVTYGPGLAPCLAMGITFAQSLGLARNIPVVGVNHLRGHALSPFLFLYQEDPIQFHDKLQSLLPHLGLIVSGGNTLLFVIDNQFNISIIAQTSDDAAGEAIDKGARLLGLPYPGGPHLEKLASTGNASAYAFPRAVQSSNDFRFSFSGLKTSLRYTLEKIDKENLSIQLHHLAASYQTAIIDQLTRKTNHALNAHHYKSIGLSGGVANNQSLRKEFQLIANTHSIPLLLTSPTHCSDNASMIAFASYIDPHHTLPAPDYNLDIAPTLLLTQ